MKKFLFSRQSEKRDHRSNFRKIRLPNIRSLNYRDLIIFTLKSVMGLRSGKFLNFRSVIGGSSSQEITNSSLPLISLNSPSTHQKLSNSSSLSFSSTTSNHNNNNNNDSNFLIPVFYYSHLINHASLDSSKFYPTRLEILLDRPPVSREKQIEYGWNHEDRSMNIFVKHNDPCTFHRHVSYLFLIKISIESYLCLARCSKY